MIGKKKWKVVRGYIWDTFGIHLGLERKILLGKVSYGTLVLDTVKICHLMNDETMEIYRTMEAYRAVAL